MWIKFYTKRTEKDRKETHCKSLRTIQINSPSYQIVMRYLRLFRNPLKTIQNHLDESYIEPELTKLQLSPWNEMLSSTSWEFQLSEGTCREILGKVSNGTSCHHYYFENAVASDPFVEWDSNSKEHPVFPYASQVCWLKPPSPLPVSRYSLPVRCTLQKRREKQEREKKKQRELLEAGKRLKNKNTPKSQQSKSHVSNH